MYDFHKKIYNFFEFYPLFLQIEIRISVNRSDLLLLFPFFVVFLLPTHDTITPRLLANFPSLLPFSKATHQYDHYRKCLIEIS